MTDQEMAEAVERVLRADGIVFVKEVSPSCIVLECGHICFGYVARGDLNVGDKVKCKNCMGARNSAT